MTILLDTHIILWALSDDPKLPNEARKIIEHAENEIYYSIVSLWEIELKHIAHPMELFVSAKEIDDYCKQGGYNLLPLRKTHIFGLRDLKRDAKAALHKDPFDRLLICQAEAENMIFMTHDARLAGYNKPFVMMV